MNQAAFDAALALEYTRFSADPLGFVRFNYPWGEGELAEHPGARAWQAEQLDTIGRHLRNPETRFQPIRIAIASGHGIGKSANIGQIMNWAMSTCVDCKIVVTANTDKQLRKKTWPEVSKWFRLGLNAHWFTVNATSIVSNDKAHEMSWMADAIPWTENNSEAFAGLHNQGKRIVVVMDEASAVADKIWEVIEGALTDEDTEIILLVYGNPTRATGSFRECFRKNKHRWVTKQIDSREVEGTNKAEIEKWIEDHGIDSDFIKVRVRGLFPNLSAKQYISEKDVDAAYGRELRPEQYNWAPKILTLDPAWEGDDELVIGLRQGLKFSIIHTMPKNDNDVEVANILARFEDEHQADAVFIDGGYGTGIISVGRTWKRNWTIVWFSGESSDPGCLNKRAEMKQATKKWLKEGGSIPKDEVLRDDLLGPETIPRLDGKLQIESKKDMKRRGLPSPNRGDALDLSFAFHVQAKDPGPQEPEEFFSQGNSPQGWMA